jgi:hypothetical protein
MVRALPLAAWLLSTVLGAACAAAPVQTPGQQTPGQQTQGPSAVPTPVPTSQPTMAGQTPLPTVIASPTIAPSSTPDAPPTPPGAQTITSDDGLLTIEIPEGALSEPVTITATRLTDTGEIPDGPPAFAYSLEPDGLTFDAPVRITRQLELPQDLEKDTVPVVTLASQSSADAWEWLAEQQLNVEMDTETFTVSGSTDHFSGVFAIFEQVLLSYHLSQPNFVAPVDEQFYLVSGVYTPDRDNDPPISEPTPFADDPVVTPAGHEMFTPQSFFRQLYGCNMPGTTRIGASFEVMNLGQNAPGSLPSVNLNVNVNAMFDCLTTSNPPMLLGACLTHVDQPLGEFPTRLVGDFSFDGSPDQQDINVFQVGIAGANNGVPVDATEESFDIWQANFGFAPGGPAAEVVVAETTTADGVVHDILPAVRDSIGNIPNNFRPGDSVGDLCGGF